MDIDVMEVLKIAKQAGEAIMTVYGREFSVEEKEDKSPVTEADLKAHTVIYEALQERWPEIPVLSEEGRSTPYEERCSWEWLWVVDPLDGTKEFIKKNGEFTVNIALVHQRKPVLGVVVAPALGMSYWAKVDKGAFREVAGDIQQLPCQKRPEGVTRVVASRSHMSEETREFIEKLDGKVELVSMGSSLKLCLVAEGSAEVYPRLAPTMEWDTAAAQAVIEVAGRSVVAWESGEPLVYNKPDLLNPWFVVR